MAFPFIGGYNEKKYKKNSELFKVRIQAMMFECSNEMGIGKLLNAIMLQLDRLPYPAKAESKEALAVDERIEQLLATMERDVQEKAFARLSAHADILRSAVEDARKYGCERYNQEELGEQSKMADCKGAIYQQLVQKAELAARKEKLLAEGKKYQAAGKQADLLRIRLEYNECDAAEKACDTAIDHYTKMYNTAVAVVNRRKIGKMAVELQNMHIVTPEQFAREEARTNELIAKAMEQADEVQNIAAESDAADRARMGGSATSTAFDDAMAAANYDDMSSSIDGATVAPPAAQTVEDPFAPAIRK